MGHEARIVLEIVLTVIPTYLDACLPGLRPAWAPGTGVEGLSLGIGIRFCFFIYRIFYFL